jgi:hypothetical protein
MSLNNTFSMIQQNLNRYFCPICLILGLIGCLFNILLFSQKQFRTISCCTCKFIFIKFQIDLNSLI